MSRLLLFGDLLEVLVDDSNSEEDTGSRPDGAHKVSEDAKGSNTDSTERGSCGDASTENADHGVLSDSTFEHQVLRHKLADNVSWG